MKNTLMKIFNGLKSYLTDWKNLAVHAGIGILLVCTALFLPIPPLARVGVLAVIIAFNTIRMKLEKKEPEPRSEED